MKPQVTKHPIITDDLCMMMRQFELKAIEYGSVLTNTNKPYGEEFRHLYRLNYIADGHVFYTCCGKTTRIEANTLVYLPPESILEVEEGGENVVLFFINFEVGNLALRQQFNDFMSKTFPQYHVHDKNNRIRSFFNFMFDEGSKKEIGYCMSIQGVFYNIIISMIRLSFFFHNTDKEIERVTGSIGYFNQAIHYINQNINKNIKISDIASAIGISEIYLYKIFVKHAKKSPQQLLLAYRIQLAKNYLRNPSLSIKAISNELGFSNPNHFSTLFKKSIGMSPKEYRLTIFDEEPVQLIQEETEKCSCESQ